MADTFQKPVQLELDGRIARITLNRPDNLNAIDEEMPAEIERAVRAANKDSDVRVIVLSGAGRAFCSGYDLEIFAEAPRPAPGSQEMPWDPMVDYELMSANTRHFMSLWRSHVPVICKVHGFAVAGGSDIALCCDQIVMAEDAKIGYPPARVWGCPTTAMWVYRLGLERAKRMLLTGDLVDGARAERIGLVSEAVPSDELDERVESLAQKMTSIPRNQLMMHKMLVNQAYSNMGMQSTQMLATLFDGMARHTPEGVAFKKRAEDVGFKRAVQERDSVDD
jgi:enoyl-CoA hydratase